MTKVLVAAAFVSIVAAGPGHAQAPRNAPVQGPAQLQVSAADCRRLVQALPSGDVTYRPGVDVYGRAVAPADLSPAPSLGLPDRMTLSLEADLRRYGVPATSPLFQPNVGVGAITFDSTGAVWFNGQRLGGTEQSAIADACRRQLPGR